MSILAILADAVATQPVVALPTTSPTTQPIEPMQQFWVALAFLLPAIAIAALAGVFRRRSIEGPVRLGADVPAGPMLFVTAIGASAWFLTQVAYGAIRAGQYGHTHPGEPFGQYALGAFDYAFLGTVPATIALVILLIGDLAVKQHLPRRIGYLLGQFPAGALKGLLAALIIIPLMTSGGLLLDLFYRAIGYEHPQEHDLLGAMRNASAIARAVLIFGACIAAPVFEELFFRGHLQTLLVRAFSPRPQHAFEIMPAEMLASNSSATPEPPGRLVLWIAVIVTSLAFTAVHPLWTMPLIFILSLCLGYAYERTGNLWVPIAIHALFNICSTGTFLNWW